MRYFLLIFALGVISVMAIAGKRGSMSRKPPVHVFPDMDKQPKLRPQTVASFFPDGRSSRLPVDGTIPRLQPMNVAGKSVYPFEENAVNTGRDVGSTNFVMNNPMPITEGLLKRGQERYQIYCLPCHGPVGDGKGVTTKYGMVGVANFHDPRLVGLPDGDIFNTITHGKNLMGPYGAMIETVDRWAVVAYVRALQRSRLASLEDVPADVRSKLPAAPPPAARPQTNAAPAAK